MNWKKYETDDLVNNGGYIVRKTYNEDLKAPYMKYVFDVFHYDLKGQTFEKSNVALMFSIDLRKITKEDYKNMLEQSPLPDKYKNFNIDELWNGNDTSIIENDLDLFLIALEMIKYEEQYDTMFNYASLTITNGVLNEYPKSIAECVCEPEDVVNLLNIIDYSEKDVNTLEEIEM